MRIRLLALLTVLALTSAVAAPAWPTDVQPDGPTRTRAAAGVPFLDPLAPYGGLGTWTDIYDERIYQRPVATVEADARPRRAHAVPGDGELPQRHEDLPPPCRREDPRGSAASGG